MINLKLLHFSDQFMYVIHLSDLIKIQLMDPMIALECYLTAVSILFPQLKLKKRDLRGYWLALKI